MNNRIVKVLSFIFILIFSFILVGCKNNDEELLQSYYDKLTIDTTIDGYMELPMYIDNLDDHNIGWSVETEADINFELTYDLEKNCHTITIIECKEEVVIELVATIELNNGLAMNKVFSVTILKKEATSIKEKYDCISIADAIEIAKDAGESGTEESYYVW